MSKKILFFGNERLATGVETKTPILRELIEADYDIGAVIVAQDETGPSRKGRQLEVAALATDANIPLLSPAKLMDVRDKLAGYKAEAAILIAYGQLVPQEIISLFPRGIVNLHPSLLPKHRGSIPIESIILEGATETGVSLMALAAEMDAGPIYAQETIALTGHETKPELTDKLLRCGRDMILSHLPAILDGSLEPQPQDDTKATYDQRLKKEDSIINWQKSAVQIEREVRAYAGWPRSRTQLGDTDVIITQASVSEGSGEPGSLYLGNKQLGVYASDGIVIIDSLIPAGKKEMPAQAFLAGYNLNENSDF